MRRALSLVLVAAALVALFGCEELLLPGFPHRAHLTAEHCGKPGEPECPTCGVCHDPVRKDLSSALPGEELCRRCHQDPQAVMAKVRFGTQKRTDIVFSHQDHLGRADIQGQCVGCHAGVASDGVRGDVYPPMQQCLGCHDDGLAATECTSCHRRRDLRALLPESFLRHDAAFFADHGSHATTESAVCSQCHAESDCARCHDESQRVGLADVFPEAVDRPLIHRADFVDRHAIEARSSRDCARCHQPSYCDACHLERGVSGNRASSISPHPIGWVGPDPTAPTFHGRDARRDIVACASCHEAGPATNCIRCHRVGGPGGNPHPAGWRSARSPDAPMCRFCHE